jgi:transcriptional regulator with XRE-family HTH domain
MKRTEEDRLYGEEFARRVRPYYERALATGQTADAFALRLGVKRGALQRYLRDSATPSLRSVVFAYREFGIAIPYDGIDVKAVAGRRARRKRTLSELQMKLPLTIEASEGEISVVIKKKAPQRYRLQLEIRKTV